MGDETGGVERFTVRLSLPDYAALEAEADAKGVKVAVFARDIIKAHLNNQEIEDRLEEKLGEFIESEKFDELFLEKIGRFFEARKRT